MEISQILNLKSASNLYRDIAVRGDEVLVMGLDYTANGSEGSLIVRFLLRKLDGKFVKLDMLAPLLTLALRESSMVSYRTNTGEKVYAVRLNKVPVGVFKSNPPSPQDLGKIAIDLGIDVQLVDWLTAMVAEDTFEVIGGKETLLNSVRLMLGGTVTTIEDVKMEFPNMKSDANKLKGKQQAMASIKKFESDDEDSFDEDEDDSYVN